MLAHCELKLVGGGQGGGGGGEGEEGGDGGAGATSHKVSGPEVLDCATGNARRWVGGIICGPIVRLKMGGNR